MGQPVSEVAREELTADIEPARGEEAQKARPMRDPGAPTQAEIDAHNVTHLP